MAYNVYKEMGNVARSVAAILRVEDVISEEAGEGSREVFDWALGRAAELETAEPNRREEACYLQALREAHLALRSRGWDFDPNYQI